MQTVTVQIQGCLHVYRWPDRRYRAKNITRTYNDNDYGVPLNSHISQNGTGWVFFDPFQLLPCDLININKVSEVKTELLKYDIPFVENLKLFAAHD